MYSVRLLMRCFAREGFFLNLRSAHSSNSNPKYRTFNKNQNDQLAGIRKQAQAMDYTPDEITEFEDLDDEEINMSMAEQVFDTHMGEIKQMERKQTLAAYGQKYYKQKKEPPLLSWNDVEEIRRLHLKEKWPISTLAKSFPATEAIIKKVLKSFRDRSLEEQFQYDEKVAQNWILLRKGKLEISNELKHHCLKFTNRVARPMTSRDIAVINKKPVRPPGSFLNMIKAPDSEKEEDKQGTAWKSEKEENDTDSHHYSHNDILLHLRKRMTLEQARKKELELIAETGFNVDRDVKAYVCGPGPSKDHLSPQEGKKEEYINPNTYAKQPVATKAPKEEFISKWDRSGKSVKAAKDIMMAPLNEYPDRIVIPETAKKPGAIYRVDDCFYNENGEFMYRVPGLKL